MILDQKPNGEVGIRNLSDEEITGCAGQSLNNGDAFDVFVSSINNLPMRLKGPIILAMITGPIPCQNCTHSRECRNVFAGQITVAQVMLSIPVSERLNLTPKPQEATLGS